jgi:hypothetical protein
MSEFQIRAIFGFKRNFHFPQSFASKNMEKDNPSCGAIATPSSFLMPLQSTTPVGTASNDATNQK